MLLSDVANSLQDKLNSSELTFKITANEQQWFNYAVMSADNMDYVAGVVRALPIPIITEFYRTRALQYAVTLKGKVGHLNDVETLVNELSEFIVNDKKWYLSNFVVEGIGNARDGERLSREFRANFRVSIFVPLFITGADVKLKINDEPVDFVRLNGVFSKALVPNRMFDDDNESEISTGEEYVFTFPLSDNATVNDIFSNVVSKAYNKEYDIEIDFISVNKVMPLVLSGGNFNMGATTETAVFSAIFTRTTERTPIKINGETINVIGFTPNGAGIPKPLNKGGKTLVRNEANTVNYQMSIENDKSVLVTDIVKEIFNNTNKKFIIEWEFNDETITTECVIQTGNVPTSENPNALVNVVFGAGYFYGN